MKLLNPWIGYFDRTYDQIKANVLQKFQFLVPEITDDTETNPWVQGVSVWAGICELLGYYLDNNAREYYITTAREFRSAVKTAKGYDYRIKGANAATVTLRFTSNIAATGNITIPSGTRCRTGNNEIFTTTQSGIILTGTTFIDIPAKQMDFVNTVALGVSTGLADQSFVLEEDVVDASINVLVDVVPYQGQDTFFFSIPTDTHYVAGLNEDAKMAILFGDGINGKIPPSSQSISATYYVTLGLAGNGIGIGKVNVVISTITVPGAEVISVSNAAKPTGGADQEGLTQLQKRVPLSIRTLYRAVTDQDFIDVTELFNGVEKAGEVFDCDVDEFVNIFIVPQGGGLASSGLITDVYNFMIIRSIVGKKLKVQSAGEVQFIVQVNIKALPGYNNALIKSNAEDGVLDFFAPENQLVNGNVTMGDLYQVLEDLTGVQYSEITLLLPIPYARNITTPTNVLDWDRVELPASAGIVKWLIRFITNSQFELYRFDDFMGGFNVDTLVTMTEIEFTVNGNHVGGDNYQFFTYAYNMSVFLTEPSIPAALLSNLTINVTGGV